MFGGDVPKCEYDERIICDLDIWKPGVDQGFFVEMTLMTSSFFF